MEAVDDMGLIAGDMNDDDADYYVYSYIYGTPSKRSYVNMLMRKFGWDFMTFASMRIQCTDWGDVLNISSEYDGNDIEYKGYAFYSNSTNSSNKSSSTYSTSSSTYSFPTSSSPPSYSISISCSCWTYVMLLIMQAYRDFAF